MKSRIFALIFFSQIVLFTACKSKKNDFVISLDDSIKQVVLSYIKENNVDLKSKVITTDWVINDYRADVYISSINTQLYKKQENTPVYYSVLSDSVVVFIYAGIEKAISRNTDEIVSEIDEILMKCQIQLSADNGRFYHAPTWLYSSCGEKSRLLKKLPPLEYNYIPCGYTLMQDTIRKDSLYIFRMHK